MNLMFHSKHKSLHQRSTITDAVLSSPEGKHYTKVLELFVTRGKGEFSETLNELIEIYDEVEVDVGHTFKPLYKDLMSRWVSSKWSCIAPETHVLLA